MTINDKTCQICILILIISREILRIYLMFINNICCVPYLILYKNLIIKNLSIIILLYYLSNLMSKKYLQRKMMHV